MGFGGRDWFRASYLPSSFGIMSRATPDGALPIDQRQHVAAVGARLRRIGAGARVGQHQPFDQLGRDCSNANAA